MIRRLITSICVLTLLASCATFGQMQAGLNDLVGQDKTVAFDVLGYPSGEQKFDSDTVYFWSVSQSGAIVVPQTATTYGTVGMTPVYGTTTYNQVVPVNYSCLIKLITGEDGIIKKWEYSGNLGGCRTYINRLHAYAKSRGQ